MRIILALVLILCFTAVSAQAACTDVTLGICGGDAGGVSGSWEWDSGNSVYRYCDGTNWLSITETATGTNGFFVLSSLITNAAMGGLTGADQLCLNDLKSHDWKDRCEAVVTADHVKAFLCDSTTCNNLDASTTYKFAVSGDDTKGGATFTTDATGRGPGDDWNVWSLSSYFGSIVSYWTNRGEGGDDLWATTQEDNDSANVCTDWADARSGSAYYGSSGNSNAARWFDNSLAKTCQSSARLICIVNP